MTSTTTNYVRRDLENATEVFQLIINFQLVL